MIMKATGKTLDQVLEILAEKSGLLGLSGVSGDIRDLEDSSSKRKHSCPFSLGRLRRRNPPTPRRLAGGTRRTDVVVFTGGIGENATNVRTAVCGNLQKLGIILDPTAKRKSKRRMPN